MESRSRHLPANLLTLALLTCGLWACSSSNGDAPGSGGRVGSGGAVSSGGASGSNGSGGKSTSGGASGSGGAKSSGGSQGSGGTKASGGSDGSGGVQEAGGSVGAGGSNTGGSKATGGASTGGSAAGGSAAGGAGTGGAMDGGAATGGGAGKDAGTGGPAAGGSGAGGTGSGGSQGKSSPGCGSTSPLKTSNSLTENINGTTRKWMLDVPTNYDTNKPYRLIFVWHPLGGSGSQIVSGGYNGLKSLANNTAIFATADGLNGSNSEASGTGWWNANGGDMKLLQAMLDKINAGLCVDQDRIFSTGFSFGGMMSYTVGFQFDVFRAVAPCSGKTGVIPYDDNNDAPLPIMAFHGDSDTFVATSLGKAFLDMYAKRNKCGTQTKAVSPSPCVEYQDCVAPTIWCVFPGAHTTWSEEPKAIWNFFSQF